MATSKRKASVFTGINPGTAGTTDLFGNFVAPNNKNVIRPYRTVESNAHQYYIEQKVKSIQKEYSAYTILAYASTNTADAYSVMYYSPDMAAEELDSHIRFYRENEYQARLIRGESISEQTSSSDGTVITIGVPILLNDTVIGGVFIHTTTQSIRELYIHLFRQTLILSISFFVLFSVIAFFIAKRLTKPLSYIAKTAVQMQQGDYSARAPIKGSKEVQELAVSFNNMAVQFEHIDQSRRDFVANVTHELKSPVTSIQGYTEGMLDGTIEGAEDQQRCLKIISDETHRLSKLINNLLRLSRMEKVEQALNYSDFDIHEALRRVLITQINRIEKQGLSIEMELKDEPLYVHADKDAIEQVLVNLLDNAIKYTPASGTITLAVSEEKNLVRFSISDNGIGIPESDRPFIFDRFYMVDKAHTSGKGTGLGLAICQKIMQRHKQSIQLTRGDGGCTFEITLEKSEKGARDDQECTCKDQLGT